MRKHLGPVLFGLTLAVASSCAAQTATPAQASTQATAQPMDPDYTASVKDWTTKPEFLSPLVDHLPVSSAVPSPKPA